MPLGNIVLVRMGLCRETSTAVSATMQTERQFGVLARSYGNHTIRKMNHFMSTIVTSAQ
jgi:spore maturation protein SpmB